MSRDERRLSAIPGWLWVALGAALSLQLWWHGTRAPRPAGRAELPPAPSAQALRLAAFGEVEAASRLAMLYVQSRNHRDLDYARLVGWLEAALSLDPRSDYPLFAAARVYAEHPDPVRSRMALEFVYQAYLADPNRRWPALAHAALLAKHRLKDLALARRYAAALERHTTARGVPLWARQMEIFSGAPIYARRGDDYPTATYQAGPRLHPRSWVSVPPASPNLRVGLAGRAKARRSANLVINRVGESGVLARQKCNVPPN